MVKRWIIGGVWVVLVAAGLWACGRSLRAEKPAASGKVLISDIIISGNQRVSAEKIKAHLHTQIGKEYNPSVVEDDVRELYKTHKFSNITTFLQDDGRGKAKIFFALREKPNMVRKVTFLGAKHIKEEELRKTVGIDPGMPLNPNLNLKGCQYILAKYEEMGRSFSHCKLIQGSDLTDTEVVYQITEGPKVKVRDIRFTGNTFVKGDRLKTHLKTLIGGVYNKQTAEADIETLCNYYRGFGFIDVRVSLESQRSTNGKEATLIFHMQEGLRYRVADKAELVAPKSLPRKHLQDLMKIGEGDYLNENALYADVKRIKDYCQSLHHPVHVDAIPTWLPDQPGLANIRYEVKEIRSQTGKPQ